MPRYNYHIKFELYSTSDPSADTAANDIDAIWVPAAGSSIFDELPSHPRKHQRNVTKPTTSRTQQDAFLSDKGKHASIAVIDCGADRARSSSPDDSAEKNIVRLTDRQWRARSQSIPAPGFAAGLGPRRAGRDWRFGGVSVESFDPEQQDTDPMAGGKEEESQDHAGPAPSLGPTFGGPGQATKGRYVPLETTNTEVGWGIVHLYREGEEGYDSQSREDGVTVEGGSGSGDGSDDGDDGTILCIPAVPSYLSPSDFLGFVGEKWRGDVCHYRMVMTSRMNRYMVLMKFQDKWKAAEWRKEFDGRGFNSMEVGLILFYYFMFTVILTVYSPRYATSHTSSPSPSRHRRTTSRH